MRSHSRALVAKVKAYCMRFASVLTRTGLVKLDENMIVRNAFLTPFSWLWFGRNFKYDSKQLEYFVETEEKVTLKRSDLEAVRKAEVLEPDAAMPQPGAVGPSALMALPSGQQAIQDGGAPPPLQSSTHEAKHHLDTFVESLHKKASQATSWINTLEEKPATNGDLKNRQLQRLGLIFIFHILAILTACAKVCEGREHYPHSAGRLLLEVG